MEIVATGTPPCKNCEERNVTCHAGCERYLTWLEKKRAADAVNRRGDAANGFLVDNRMNRAAKMQRGVGTGIKLRNVWGK